ncbi:MAG TPA: substrate-binding domain-containing protein [Chthoniobacteraceae bacterium]|nr:substrate-binding domain-containing protein [Chthoniobacteraceae bacterium]
MPSCCPPSAPRPSEKVLEFFWEQLWPAHTLSGKRLPTIREIARHLEVSTSTVQTVFAQLAKEGHLTMTMGRGTFLSTPGPEETETIASATATPVAPVLTVAAWEEELAKPKMTWAKGVGAGILHETAKNAAGLTVKMFFVDRLGADPQSAVEEADRAQAAIVFPHLDSNAPLIAAFRKQKKPIVYINAPSPTATCNFVGPDFFHAAHAIGRVWKEAGRRHAVLLFHRELMENAQCAAMLAGVTAAFGPDSSAHGLELSYRTFPNGIPTGLDACLERLFAGPTPPDAIYTSVDNLAEATLQWLLRRKFRVPEEVSVICGTGVYPSDAFSLPCTTVQTPFEEIGREAVKMAATLMENGNRPLPGVWLKVGLHLRQTTTDQENRHLAQCFEAL